jgi:hypothetical protein
MANPLEELIESASAIAKGMGVTFKEMMSPTTTENYPDEPPKFQERFRGVRGGVPFQLHLYRGGGKHRAGPHLGRRALRQGLQYRL